MSNRKKFRKQKKNARCIMTGKLTENKEVVIAEHAIHYVRKLGFIVLPSMLQSIDVLNRYYGDYNG